MKKLFVTVRIDMSLLSGVALDDQICNLCAIQQAAGYTLTSTFVVAENLVLIFRLT